MIANNPGPGGDGNIGGHRFDMGITNDYGCGVSRRTGAIDYGGVPYRNHLRVE